MTCRVCESPLGIGQSIVRYLRHVSPVADTGALVAGLCTTVRNVERETGHLIRSGEIERTPGGFRLRAVAVAGAGLGGAA